MSQKTDTENRTESPTMAPPREAPASHPVTVREPPLRDPVEDMIAVFDTRKFDHMMRVAKVLAAATLVPDSLLKYARDEGDKKKGDFLPAEMAIANCFLVVNQAFRWHMDPFAVAQSVFVHKGKIGYEGKLVAAVVNSHPLMAERLRYIYEGEGAMRRVVVSGRLRGEDEYRSVEGTKSDWATDNEQWKRHSSIDQMLAYRGAREWARRHNAEALLGVFADDELVDDVSVQPEQPARKPRSASAALDKFAGTTIEAKAEPADDAAERAAKSAAAAKAKRDADDAAERAAIRGDAGPGNGGASPQAGKQPQEAKNGDIRGNGAGKDGKAPGGPPAATDDGMPKPHEVHVSQFEKGKFFSLWAWLRTTMAESKQEVRIALAAKYRDCFRMTAAHSTAFGTQVTAFLDEMGLDSAAILKGE